jgi:hypothetical protein
MTITATLDTPSELACLRERRLGWSICYGPAGGRVLGWVERRGCLRVLLGEPIDGECEPGLEHRLLGVALTALVGGISAADTADRITSQGGDLWVTRLAPRLGIAVLDLFESGHVEIACRYSPSVLHLRHGEPVAMLPEVPGFELAMADVQTGDRLVAYSGSFLGSLPPETVSEVPELACDQVDSVAVWRRLIASREESARNEPATLNLLIITRSG